MLLVRLADGSNVCLSGYLEPKEGKEIVDLIDKNEVKYLKLGEGKHIGICDYGELASGNSTPENSSPFYAA